MTEDEQKVIDAAREWLAGRTPKDHGEMRLAAAVCRAYPDEMGNKEACQCGDAEDCDECPTAVECEAIVSRWERESTPIAEAC